MLLVSQRSRSAGRGLLMRWAPGSPGRPRWPARPIRSRPRGLLGCRSGGGPGPLPPLMRTGNDKAECGPPHPHLTFETVGFPRAHTGHTQETPELGIPQRPPLNPQHPEVPVTPSPAESGPQGPRTLADGAVAGSGRAEPRASTRWPSRVQELTLAWGLEPVHPPAFQSRDTSPGQPFCQPLRFHQRWRPIRAAFRPGKLEGGKREPNSTTLSVVTVAAGGGASSGALNF